MLTSLRSHFAVVLGLMVAAVLGLAHVLRDLSVDAAPFPKRGSPENYVAAPVPLSEAQGLFAVDAVPSQSLADGMQSGFHTAHFAPPPKPKPRKPTMRNVQLTYLGFLQAGKGPRTAIVQVDDQQWIGGAGSNLVANVAIASIRQQSLVVTNTEGQTNELPFRTKTPLEIPLP